MVVLVVCGRARLAVVLLLVVRISGQALDTVRIRNYPRVSFGQTRTKGIHLARETSQALVRR